MIITLNGADFSNSNIGKFGFWSVTQNITGYTLSSSSTTPVKNKDSYVATLTPLEGYILSHAVVTMNNIDITSCLTWNNNTGVGTLSIPSVTGDIVIKAVGTSTIINLLEFTDEYTNMKLRFSPGNGSIVSANGTKYLLFKRQLDPNSTYVMKFYSGVTGGLFASEPVNGSVAAETINFSSVAYGSPLTINVGDTNTWIALNIATNETNNLTDPVTPVDAWLTKNILYKVE